jgi:hypothetical protein
MFRKQEYRSKYKFNDAFLSCVATDVVLVSKVGTDDFTFSSLEKQEIFFPNLMCELNKKYTKEELGTFFLRTRKMLQARLDLVKELELEWSYCDDHELLLLFVNNVFRKVKHSEKLNEKEDFVYSFYSRVRYGEPELLQLDVQQWDEADQFTSFCIEYIFIFPFYDYIKELSWLCDKLELLAESTYYRDGPLSHGEVDVSAFFISYYSYYVSALFINRPDGGAKAVFDLIECDLQLSVKAPEIDAMVKYIATKYNYKSYSFVKSLKTTNRAPRNNFINKTFIFVQSKNGRLECIYDEKMFNLNYISDVVESFPTASHYCYHRNVRHMYYDFAIMNYNFLDYANDEKAYLDRYELNISKNIENM